MNSTLILNADGTPLSIIPLSSSPWEGAINYLWSDTARALHYYENWVVRSPSIEMRVPAVCILRNQISIKRRLRVDSSVGPTPKLVFLRDGFQCQYCGGVFSCNQLTMDHVIPKAYGGKTKWQNIATACYSCNGTRGHDVRIRPLNEPYRPSYYQLVKIAKRFPITVAHESWTWYLGWDEKLVTVTSPPKSGRTITTDVFAIHNNFAIMTTS